MKFKYEWVPQIKNYSIWGMKSARDLGAVRIPLENRLFFQTPRRPPGSLIFGSSISSSGPMSGGIPDRNNFNSGNQPQSSVVEQERKLNEIMNQVQFHANSSVIYARVYRVAHLLANLGWVDFGVGRSTILPTCSATSVNVSSAQAELGRGWNNTNQSQPNPGSPGDA